MTPTPESLALAGEIVSSGYLRAVDIAALIDKALAPLVKDRERLWETCEPRIHSHIDDCLPEDHPLAFKQVYCDTVKGSALAGGLLYGHDVLLHAANNECMATWIETNSGNFCWECAAKKLTRVLGYNDGGLPPWKSLDAAAKRERGAG